MTDHRVTVRALGASIRYANVYVYIARMESTRTTVRLS